MLRISLLTKNTYLNHFKLILNNSKSCDFLTGYIGFFNVTNSNKKFIFKKSTTEEDGFIQITISPGAYETESLNNEIKWFFIEKGHFSETNHPCTIKPNFSTIGSIREKSPQGPIISFMFDDSIRDLLGFHAITLHEEYILSPIPVDILSFDNSFLECDIAHGLSFKGKISRISHNFTMNVDPGYK